MKYILLIIFFLPSLSFSEDVQEIVKEIYLETDSRQQAQASALNELSRDLVIEMIGEEKYQKEQNKIEEHIIKNKNRYILSFRTSKPVLQDSGDFLSTVTIKFSKENLQTLLLEYDLFYASKGSSCLVPVLTFSSQFKNKRQSYSWWLDDKPSPFLKSIASQFFDLLSEELIKKGLYTFNPVFQRMKKGTPSSVLPTKSSRLRNFIPLSKFYTCDIVLSGSVHIGEQSEKSSSGFFSFFQTKEEKPLSSSSYQTEFFFNVFNIKTRQFLFKLKKDFPFSPEGKKAPKSEALSRFKDVLGSVVYQLSSYQDEGSLDLNQLIISVQGPLKYSEKEMLKKLLVQKIQGLKSLEERLLTSNRVVYSAEASQSMRSIAKQLKSVQLESFMIQVKGYKKQELEIYARKR